MGGRVRRSSSDVMSMSDRGYVRYNVFLFMRPEAMAELKDAAFRNRRSLASHIAFLLEEHLSGTHQLLGLEEK